MEKENWNLYYGHEVGTPQPDGNMNYEFLCSPAYGLKPPNTLISEPGRFICWHGNDGNFSMFTKEEDGVDVRDDEDGLIVRFKFISKDENFAYWKSEKFIK